MKSSSLLLYVMINYHLRYNVVLCHSPAVRAMSDSLSVLLPLISNKQDPHASKSLYALTEGHVFQLEHDCRVLLSAGRASLDDLAEGRVVRSIGV